MGENGPANTVGESAVLDGHAAISNWAARKVAGLSVPSLDGLNFSTLELGAISLADGSLTGANFSSASLTNANLANANLTNANLTNANLTNANLTNANFTNANLTNATLKLADLTNAKFDGAEMVGVTLRGCRIAGTSMRSANLTRATFPTAVISYRQIAGADLTAAVLPDKLTFDQALNVTGETSKSARTLFLSMLTACLYCLLTIGTTRDRSLILQDVASPLPVIGVPIPSLSFYYVAPLLLLSLFIYFHLYLQTLWDRISELPARLPTGTPIDDASCPWLMSRLVKLRLTRLRKTNDLPPFLWLSELLSIGLGYLAVPCTLYALWGRSLAYHDSTLSCLQSTVLVGSLLGASSFFSKLNETLVGGASPLPGEAMRLEASGWHRVGFVLLRRVAFVRWTAAAAVLAALLSVSIGTAHMTGTGYYPSVPLFRSVLVAEREILTSWDEKTHTGFGPQLRERNLKGARLERSNLSHAILESADLEGAHLYIANLNSAKMFSADLSGANLSEADLGQADLVDANLVGARFYSAKMEGANIQIAKFGDTKFRFADLTNADLRGTQLDHVDLCFANLDGAKFDTAKWTVPVQAKAAGKMDSVEALVAASKWSNVVCSQYNQLTEFPPLPDAVTPEKLGMHESADSSARKLCDALVERMQTSNVHLDCD